MEFDTSKFVIGKNPCPFRKCNSSDGFHFYGEGNGGYCWSCQKGILSDAKKAELGIDLEEEEDEEVSTRERITPEEVKQIQGYTTFKGMGYRGIRDETYKFFGIRHEYNEQAELEKQYYPTTMEGVPAGYKTRAMPKDFTNPIGIVGKDCDMFGERNFKNFTRTIIITGGETKVASTYQMLKDDLERRGKDFDPTAVVCSTLGETGAYKQVQSRYEFFNQFAKIIICMDNDQPGRDAAEKIAKVLPKGKVFIMKMRLKDSDDYLAAGKEKDFVQDFWSAKAYTPDGIVASTELSSKVRELAMLPKIPLPPFMHKAQKMMAGGIPLKVIVNIASASGTGKSTIVEEMEYYWIFNSPYTIGTVTLESDSGQFGTKILSRHVGRKIDLIESIDEKMAFLNSEAVLAAEHELYFKPDGTPRFYLIEERDGGLESLKELIMELIIACGCQVIILDPLQDILDGLSNEDQAVFLRWMKGMIKSHDVTFINVNHVRKSQGGKQANSTGAEMFEEDIQGSSSIFKSGACNLLFTRDKEAEDPIERNTTRMKASKIRWTGVTGFAGEYYYDNEEHKMHDKIDWLQGQPAVDFMRPDPETGELTRRKPAFKVV